MVAPKISEGDFIRLFTELGPAKLASKLQTPMSGVMRRRRNIEQKRGIVLTAPGANASNSTFRPEEIPGRLHLAINNGIVLVGSDLHAWPGPAPVAFRAFVKFIKEFEPKAVILNGDVIDGASVSRHPPLGWDKQPTLIEEIEAAQERLHEIELVAPKKAELLWGAGNHDARFSTRLATVAPEYARVQGSQLKDHFGERWRPCWSVWINDGDVVVKHRARGGAHATTNNTLYSGKTIVTGHLHSLQVRPFNDYNPKTRWGVDCGMLADPYGKPFGYLEDSVRPWRAGFVMLTFRDSELLWPEIIAVRDQITVDFRGTLQRV